jgi:hypothetical protein
MIGIVLAEFTGTVNLRHFFVPLEVVPRTMTANILPFNCHDNPVRDYFSVDLNNRASRTIFGRHPAERKDLLIQ